MNDGYNIFEKIELLKKKGNRSDRKIAKFILDYDSDFIDLKISEVSAVCFVSNATVVRFAKNLDFSGFPELKLQLSYQKKDYLLDDNSNFSSSSLEKHYSDIISSFEKTKRLLTPNHINKAVEYINQAANINLFALGETNVVAQDFQLKLVRIGKVATAFPDIHTQHFCACNSNENTVSIAISYSATTKHVLDNLEVAKEYGSKTILITNKQLKIPDYVDLVLNVEATESINRVFSTTSRFSILFLLDIIYHQIIETDPDYYEAKLDETRLKR
ncbi:MAG: MurR/RpiR family transcriptional regulator [Mycoplasmatales bacterium]